MKEILLKAMNDCAREYSKGFPRWEHLWDEKRTIEQKAIDIAEKLDKMGYMLVKTKHEPAKD